MRRVRLNLQIALVLTLGACAPGRDTLESSLLREDWPAVVAHIGAGEPAPPHVRAIKAQALIALSRNNEALCLFRSLTADDLAAWHDWTRAFAAAYSRRAIARYLHGDALARRYRWNEALREFDRAVEVDPAHVLSLNARGVLRSLNSDWDGAMRDFTRAVELSPAFAEAFASRGFSHLHSRRAPDGALDAFEAALKIAPESALTVAGKAYAEIALGRWDQGTRDLETAVQKSVCAAGLIGETVVQIAAWVDRLSGIAHEELEGPPGTQIDRHLQDLSKGNIGALSAIARKVGQHPEMGVKVGQALDAIKQQNPTLYGQITDRIQSGTNWTKPGGGADTLLNSAKGLGAQVTGRLGDTTRGIAGQLSFNPGALVDQQLNKTRVDHNGWQGLEKMTGQTPAGGVTTSLLAAHVDQGDWPFLPLYGLLYGVNGGAR